MDNKLGILLTAFIAVILGLVLIDIIADSTNQTNVPSATVLNEVITYQNTTVTPTWIGTKLLTLTAVGNGTASFAAYVNNGISVNTTFIDFNGTFDNYTGQSFYVNYTYQPTEYIENGTSRVLIGLVVLFFALAVVAVGIMYVKNAGLF